MATFLSREKKSEVKSKQFQLKLKKANPKQAHKKKAKNYFSRQKNSVTTKLKADTAHA